MKTYLISFLVIFAIAARAEEKKTFEQEVLDAIEKISLQHGLTKEEGSHRARALVTDSWCWPVKGGVAVIRDQMYVLARSKNGVIAGGDKTLGSDFRTPEVFVFAGGELAGHVLLPVASEEDVVVALFTPERVRFFDWKNLSGGFYPRSTEDETEPNQSPQTTPVSAPR